MTDKTTPKFIPREPCEILRETINELNETIVSYRMREINQITINNQLKKDLTDAESEIQRLHQATIDLKNTYEHHDEALNAIQTELDATRDGMKLVMSQR
jgi:uncharacterized protein (DUF342 family)